jgi:hypothetical protein
MNLALGTVQFGMPYGIANIRGQVPFVEVKSILHHSFQAGIDTLDTAVAYGDSEAYLGKAGVSGWRIVTKLPALPDEVGNVSEWLVHEVSGSLDRLRVSSLEALLIHRPSDLLGPLGGVYCDALRLIKEQGLAAAVGVSIYDPSELDALWPAFRPDIVQAPLNVLDRRLIRSGWLLRLVGSGVQIYTRSVFLQGLLLMPAEKRPGYFERWTTLFDRWSEWCEERGCSRLQGALGYVMAQSGIDKVIVGVDSLAQLDEILAAAVPIESVPDDLFSEDLYLIEPSRWNI